MIKELASNWKKWLTFILNWSHQVNNMPSKVDLKSIPSELWGFNFANGCPSYKPVRASELIKRFYAQDELKWKSSSAADVLKRTNLWQVQSWKVKLPAPVLFVSAKISVLAGFLLPDSSSAFSSSEPLFRIVLRRLRSRDTFWPCSSTWKQSKAGFWRWQTKLVDDKSRWKIEAHLDGNSGQGVCPSEPIFNPRHNC